MMERITELETPVGVLRVTDGESTIPFDVRPNRFLDRPWKGIHENSFLREGEDGEKKA